jgi:hypothetical protein
MRSSPGKGFSTPPLKKFFSFGDAQIAESNFAKDLGQNMLELFRSEDVAQPGKTLVILCHRDKSEVLRARWIGEFVETRFG